MALEWNLDYFVELNNKQTKKIAFIIGIEVYIYVDITRVNILPHSQLLGL